MLPSPSHRAPTALLPLLSRALQKPRTLAPDRSTFADPKVAPDRDDVVNEGVNYEERTPRRMLGGRSQTRYVNMLLALDHIHPISDMLAFSSCWLLLAGFVVLLGTIKKTIPDLVKDNVQDENLQKALNLVAVAGWLDRHGHYVDSMARKLYLAGPKHILAWMHQRAWGPAGHAVYCCSKRRWWGDPLQLPHDRPAPVDLARFAPT
ncbi:hypothetical protein FA13DRAFT_1744854 [Coprinellus micaceus]|uniref:Uncharacterized protein n=1 Tax=Coprinellus micaceus TaxID=71717 RepID=A0A4Y7SDG7_COPMI|nr:hypothetical protein FA13DRAFT_1744854 [Coprinellus micaceus]